MPNWQPNWQRVRWEDGAANDAIAALNRAAEHIEAALAERLGHAATAQREWRGRFRNEFDPELERMKNRAHELAADYRRAAARIRSASQDAHDEQRRRELERERWSREKADEERRQREEEERRRRESGG